MVPRVRSGQLSGSTLPGMQVDASCASVVAGAVGRILDNERRCTYVWARAFGTRSRGAGRAEGLGKTLEVIVLPPTVIGQHRFASAQAVLRPFVGVGLSYVRF